MRQQIRLAPESAQDQNIASNNIPKAHLCDTVVGNYKTQFQICLKDLEQREYPIGRLKQSSNKCHSY